MKKLWMISAVASALLMAQEEQSSSLEAQLESKRVTGTQTVSNPLNISLILDTSYNSKSFDD